MHSYANGSPSKKKAMNGYEVNTNFQTPIKNGQHYNKAERSSQLT